MGFFFSFKNERDTLNVNDTIFRMYYFNFLLDVKLIVLYGVISAIFILTAVICITLALWRKCRGRTHAIADAESLVYFDMSDFKVE